MPHQCTNCGRTFPDGSKEMLSGCPDCGGNKFQFTPSGSGSGTGSGSSGGSAAAGSSDAAAGSASASSAADGPDAGSGHDAAPETDDESVASRAADTVRDLMSPDSASAADSRSTPNTGAETGSGTEAEPDEMASERSWPKTATEDARGGADDASDEPEGFTEWPETARRPEDRDGNAGTAPADTESEDSSVDRRKPTATLADSENTAQADARSDVVSSTELPSHTDRDDLRNRTASQSVDSSATDRNSDADSGTADTSESGASVDASASTDSTAVPDSNTDSAVEPAVDEPTAGDTVAEAGSGSDSSGDDQPPSHGRVVSEPSGDEPSMEELREELNKQFESIKIVSPGQYELNLMELYNREEYIISLQEDGRYVIDVPDSWREADE
ncbi:OapC/ArvC family zinc-ribbon domain-containing protein [Halopiger aswanensis]|uniref:Origin-associated protein OapC n=1 Tax=Halopiger aswanensis TaxID=148449 RepID=A0A3R7FUJ3_9EURY|nr:Zn-ribbon containing protein [Halopiger aswanensis]RKD93737.1 hypothetical protein ATJ93_3369 [Halopiger aswanensis]